MQGRSGDLPWPFFGCIPDFTREEPGYPISGVIPGSPADRCGLRAGDVVVRIGKSHIGIVDDFDDALQKYVGGERVRVTVRRKTASMTFEATLAPPQ
jgi:S1-C subfamily serine protease